MDSRQHGCLNDGTFGPSVHGCRDDFDFTLGFEDLILSMVPAALFIFCAILRMISTVHRPKIVIAKTFGRLKLAAISTYTSSKLAVLIVAARSPSLSSPSSIASGVVQLLAAICMLALSHVDHERSTRPSVLLDSYLFISLLLDIAQVRTYWLSARLHIENVSAAVFTVSLVLKVIILALEAQHKTKWIRWSTSFLHSPEETSGIYGLGLYSWLNKLFFIGYKKPLEMQDLFPLDRAIAAKDLYERYLSLKPKMRKSSNDNSVKLIPTLIRTLLWPLLLPVFPRMALIGFNFCQPFLLNLVLSILSTPIDETPASHKYGVIGASVLVFTGFAASTALYWYFHYRSLQMGRSVLVTALYDKATRVRNGPQDDHAAVTLMSVDIERILLGFQNMHETWACIIEIALAGWLLYIQLGASFVAAVLVALVSAGIIFFFSKKTGNAQKAWMSEVQRRVDLTAATIAKMKNIKIAGLITPISEAIQGARVHELQRSGIVRLLMISSTVISFSTYTISPILCLALSSRHLDGTSVYTSLAFLTVMAYSLYTALKSGPQIANAITCLLRIQAFLNCDEHEEYRADTSSTISEKEALHDSDEEDKSSTAIVVKAGRFGWREEHPVLMDIDIDIPKGGLTIVTGPVACGKSTLCQALLGETPHHGGQVTMNVLSGRTGYCEQTPFLANCSVRDNILGFTPFSATRYSEVIKATMLDVDFEALPHGDHTQVGSNGLVLSGGQRQRVALARALYLPTELLILDDVFSGLDADTEEQVFQRVFGPSGLLRRRNATAILCTHSVRHLPAAKHIICLTSRGSILEQGSPRELREHLGAIAEVAAESIDQSTAQHDSMSSVENRVRREISAEKSPLVQVSPPVSPLPSRSTDGDWTIYQYYIKSMGNDLALAQLIAAVVYGFTYNFPTVWLQYWTASDQTLARRSFYLGIYSLLNVSCLFTLLLIGYLVWVLAVRKAGSHLHHDALRTLINAPMSYLTKTDQGVITNLFSQDLNLLDTELANALLNTLMNVSIAIGQAAILAATTPYLAIGYPLLLAVMWVIQRFYLRTSRQLRLLDLEAKSPLYTHFLDTTRGVVSIRAFGDVSENRAKSIAVLDDSQRPSYLLFMVQQWLTTVLNFIVAALAVILIALALELRAGAGLTGASLVTLITFGENLTTIVQQWTKLESSMRAVQRLRTFNETVSTEHRVEEDVVPGTDWPSEGRIDIKNLSASYHDEPSEQNLAIRKLSLTILPGQKVAICGRTGSGKSSVIAMLLKLLEPCDRTTSQVSIDNISLHNVERATLRTRLIALPQDAVFLPEGSTFRENMDPLGEAESDTDSQAALELVRLWAVVKDQGGLDGRLTATSFSHGQQQLFALAQAVLRRRSRWRRLVSAGITAPGGVLLLDEATSSVDRDTEHFMHQIIRQEFRDWTILAVSHRLEMIMDYDKVLVMEKGELVESGHPRELVDIKTTRFSKLCKIAVKS